MFWIIIVKGNFAELFSRLYIVCAVKVINVNTYYNDKGIKKKLQYSLIILTSKLST